MTRLRLLLVACAAIVAALVSVPSAHAQPDLPCQVILDRLAVRCGPI